MSNTCFGHGWLEKFPQGHEPVCSWEWIAAINIPRTQQASQRYQMQLTNGETTVFFADSLHWLTVMLVMGQGKGPVDPNSIV
jgi:hypothetical protein